MINKTVVQTLPLNCKVEPCVSFYENGYAIFVIYSTSYVNWKIIIKHFDTPTRLKPTLNTDKLLRCKILGWFNLYLCILSPWLRIWVLILWKTKYGHKMTIEILIVFNKRIQTHTYTSKRALIHSHSHNHKTKTNYILQRINKYSKKLWNFS